MEKYLESLEKCILFKDMKKDEIRRVISNTSYKIAEYNSEDIIAIEGEACTSLGIILNGNIEIHKSFASGKLVTINHFEGGNIFGEALIFTDNGHQYPANIISTTDSIVMYVLKDDIVRLMTLDTRILSNFMGVLSNRILMLNQRITNLTLDTLRKKITNMILVEYKKQKSKHIVFRFSRKKMAEMLNVPRPSLSRELAKMKEDGLIDYYRNKIKILDLEGLRDILSQ